MNRNSRARGVPIVGQKKPSLFDQFVFMFLQTLQNKLIPRIKKEPTEPFTNEYGFAGFDEGVLIFNVSWVPREQAEKEGLYERAKADSEARAAEANDSAGDAGAVGATAGTGDGKGVEPESGGEGGAAEGQGGNEDKEREVL